MIEDEFLRLYNLYKTDVLRMAVSYLNNLADAEDVYQTVFEKLYNQLINFGDKERKYSKEWLLQVTVNECKNYFKSCWVRKILFVEDKVLDFQAPIGNNELLETLSELPKKYRLVIYLYYYEGYNIAEIGNILGKSERTIKYMLQKGREKLKSYLEEEWKYER